MWYKMRITIRDKIKTLLGSFPEVGTLWFNLLHSGQLMKLTPIS